MDVRHEVTDLDTALALGSGDVPVLATPRLIAWMEEATVLKAAELIDPDSTTVGTAVRIEHHRATPVGGVIEVAVTSTNRLDDRRLSFVLDAVDDAGVLVGHGEVDRAIVNRQRFLGKLFRSDPPDDERDQR